MDADYRFRSYSARCVGSTHDALAHSVSGLAVHIQNGGIPMEFWICCDEAYLCSEWLITPYPKSQSGEKEENFNYFLSSHMVYVEQAFGNLTARWRVLKSGLEFSLQRNSRIICLYMKIHNFCIDNIDIVAHHSGRTASEIAILSAEIDLWKYESKALEQEQRGVVQSRPRSSRVSSTKRDVLRDLVWVSDCRRPEEFIESIVESG